MHSVPIFVIMEGRIGRGNIAMAEPAIDNKLKPTQIPSNTITFVKSRFEEQEQKVGHTSPQNVANAIVGETSTLLPRVTRTIMRMETKPYLYEGAKETLGKLLRSGDKILIWTQGDAKTQLWKVATSGIGELRKDLKPEDRRKISVFSAEDKFAPLPATFDQLKKEGYERVVIVDDKSQNITRSSEEIEKWKNAHGDNSMEITSVWINQGRTKNQVPKNFTLETFKEKFKTVEDVRELTPIKDESAKKTAWLIDFDHTLVNTAEAKENLFKKIAEILAPTHIGLSPELLRQMGINGIVNAQPLKEGMSKGSVVRLDTKNQAFVVKFNKDDPKKLIKETVGYRLLQDTPLSEQLLTPEIAINDEAVYLKLPYFNGIQVRTGLREGILPQDLALKTLNELLDIKSQWWSSQEKNSSSGENSSMQRDEVVDTLTNLNFVLQQLSSKFNVPISVLWDSPIVSNNSTLPPLSEICNEFKSFLDTSPPYTVLTHGDATGGNILVNPASGQWKLIDAEWVGNSDPAEAFARMAKYVSTTTLPSIDKISLEEKPDGINADLALEIPKACKQMQETALSRITEFSHKLRDPNFGRRVHMYLTGSYLREMALTLRRGDNPDVSIFALVKAGESLIQSRNGY